MNLLFDLYASQPSATCKRHGGGKYCEIVFFTMCQRGFNFKAFWNSSKYINPNIIKYANSANIELFDLSKQTLQEIVQDQKITHIYSALPERIQPWPNCNILGTIHGLRSLEMPFDFFSNWEFDKGIIGLNSFLCFLHRKKTRLYLQNYYKRLLTIPNFSFVTVSNHSKSVIQKLCPDKSNVPVFYPPSTSTQLSQKLSNEKYFFLVSADRIEKNCTRAIIALDQLISEGKISHNFSIKITGLQENISRYKIKNTENFKFLGYVDENTLDQLYANAFAFIYPSLNEGFGYPPLEAMKYKIPVVASNAASIPEVCGDAALFFNPTSIKEMKQRISDLQDMHIYSALQNKGFKRFKEIEARQEKDLNKLVNWIMHTTI